MRGLRPPGRWSSTPPRSRSWTSCPASARRKAAAILEYREQHGPFLEPDGLLEVPGIGETLFGDIADYICVDAQEEDP
ncbi:MAG: ComEA family DNA-binding protein [Lachnospiraceae bacterium]